MTGLILAAAGVGSRLGSDTPKQFLPLQGKPIYLHSLEILLPLCRQCVVVVPSGWVERVAREVQSVSGPASVLVTAGGDTRQESVLRGLGMLQADVSTVLVHDAARPFVTAELALRTLQRLDTAQACVPGVPVAETVKSVEDGMVEATLDRSALRLIQTPQAFRRTALTRAFESAAENEWTATDEAGLVEASGQRVAVVEGDRRNIKLTWTQDLEMAEKIGKGDLMRIGNGFDFHPFQTGRPLVLGGVRIPHPKGLQGHSDADAVVHACCDALLGGCGLPDIGTLFPDDDPLYKGAASLPLLEDVMKRVFKEGYQVGNIDITILAQEPAIQPHVADIKASLAGVLQVPQSRIGLKATTMEGKGPIGRGEGLAAQVVVSLIPSRSST